MNFEALLQKYSTRIATHADRRQTVCETLRELWDLTLVMPEEDLRKEMQARIVQAYDMVKRMNRKLREYAHDWDEDFWAANTNYEADLRRRTAR